MKNQQQGFTLIEIAIVLVIIGLLLGGVLKGQELITSARVRNMISQQDGIKAAYFGFLDRYRALPGDYATASTNINCGTPTCQNGNGNGQIQATGATINESIAAWEHLSKAGFINGSYTYNATESEATTPKNPYAVYLQLAFDSTYGDSGTAQAKHNLKTGAQVPVEILAEVDRKIDDGNGLRGGFRFSQYQGNAATAPAAAAATGACINTTGDWQPTQSITNCGGASLF